MNTIVDKSKLYDVAKCLTAILVVVAHATRMYTPVGAIPVSNQSAFLNYLTNYIYAFHMPLFMMLSGCVYGHCIEQNKYSNILPFVRNKAKKLLIPYLFFGIIYVAPVMCILDVTESGYDNYVINGILLSYNSRHLWYILALFWIFLIFMLLRPLFLKGTRELVIAGCISLLLFVISRIVSCVFQIQAACNYQFFFFLGVIFNRFYNKIDHFFSKYYAVGFLLPIVLMTMFIFNPNSLLAYVYKVIGTGMIMIFCWSLLHWFPKIINNPIFCCIKKNSFGIYLFHPMIIYVLYHLLGQSDIDPILLSTIISIVATILSVYGTKIVRLLHLQWVIGE